VCENSLEKKQDYHG